MIIDMDNVCNDRDNIAVRMIIDMDNVVMTGITLL
jgi:hypothetical protein